MKKTCLLFVVLFFSFTSFVYAGNLVKKVYFSPYPILIDNEEYSSEMPILSYQDRTYVALREFSEMVGVKIDFADETIIINTKIEDSENEKNLLDVDKLNKTSTDNIEISEINPEINYVQSENQKSEIVYITKKGTKYHGKSSCGKGNYYTTTLDNAIKNGYTACKRCIN